MCGIVGAYGLPDALRMVRDGLERLEYRGYDSAGVAWLDAADLSVVKGPGTVAQLDVPTSEATTAIGHTRWATHGDATRENAHPHLDCRGDVAIVHNGTLDHYPALRRSLKQDGHLLGSHCDSEVLAHRYGRARAESTPLSALRAAIEGLEGSWAIVALDRRADALAFARSRTPLAIGLVEGGYMLASDATALVEHTDSIVYLDDGDHGLIDANGLQLYDASGDEKPPAPVQVDWDITDAERGGHPHFMHKELHEVPGAIRDALAGRLIGDDSDGAVRLDVPVLDGVSRVRLVGCGSSHHAAMIGQHLIEAWAGIPAEVVVASEAGQRPALGPEPPLEIIISQSGETFDSLEALRAARKQGRPTLAITNVRGSSVERLADAAILTRCGPEISVAATKSVAGQITCLALVALHLARERDAHWRRRARALGDLANQVEGVLAREPHLMALGRRLARHPHVFVMGRGIHVATAQEVALKLKEIAYIHAEAFGSRELKHGTFALLGPETPCLFFQGPGQHDCSQSALAVRARGSPTYLVSHGDAEELNGEINDLISLPTNNLLLSTVPFSVLGQLIAYHAADALGRPIDRPRNLAKSVTVA